MLASRICQAGGMDNYRSVKARRGEIFRLLSFGNSPPLGQNESKHL